MTLEESEAEADRILSEAGWTTTLKPPWRGRHVAPGLVGGRAPDGNAYAKAYSAFAQSEAAAMGLDPALYPDEPHEAAAVLVASIAAPVASAPEPEQIAAHETHGETGEEAAATEAAEDADVAGVESVIDGDQGGQLGAEPTDADYTLPEIELIPPEPDPTFGSELLEWEGELAAEPELAQDDGLRFIFGGNLEEKRTAAIGIVVQTAVDKMPFPINYAYFSELRNFAMGVAEGRWDNAPTKQAELAICEAVERKRRDVERVRDEKVGFLVHATLEQIEAFDPSADWPE